MHFIKGEVTVENGKSFQNATIYVRLEDVSKADAPSKVLAETILKNVNFDSSTVVIPFDLTVESIDDNSDYNVSVLIDLNNNGKLDKGDFINMSTFYKICHLWDKIVTCSEVIFCISMSSTIPN